MLLPLLLLKSISNSKSVCVTLGADPLFVVLLPVAVLSVVVLLAADSEVVAFFCLRGLLPVPYSNDNNNTMQFSSKEMLVLTE